ncbi:MAG: hypothetical protein ABIJ96_17600, partial [Elusimicrobiota bacterium]
MKTRSAICLLGLLLLAAGCATMPAQQDAFSGFGLERTSAAGKPFRDLRLAIALSENTRKSMEIIKQRSSMWSQGIDQSFVFTETINFLRDNFRSVEKVDDIDQL